MIEILIDAETDDAGLRRLREMPGVRIEFVPPEARARPLPPEVIPRAEILFCTFPRENFQEMQDRFGYVTEFPEFSFEAMSEEHGHLDVKQSSYKPKIGEKLTMIPNHVCACANMHNQIYYYRNGIIEGCWDVAARGRVR